MKKVCIQAGHGWASGGAPGEMVWTQDIVKKIQETLNGKYDVYICGKLAYEDNIVINTDWDLFLSVHYDADIYNDTGGFVDFPEPSTDGATKLSQKYASTITDHYFKVTGIKSMPNRSNANTRYYYMWKYLSTKTPCILIECGIGNRKPEDYTRLRKGDIPKILSDSIIYALEGEQQPMDYTNFDAKEDIPAIPEERIKLKGYTWYNNKWTWEDWAKFTDSTVKAGDEYIKELDRIRKENESLRTTNAKLSTENTEITGKNIALMNEVTNLNGRVKELELEVSDLETDLQSDILEMNSLKEALISCQQGTLEDLTLSDFLAWVGLKLGIKK
jgi:hypothetical protein